MNQPVLCLEGLHKSYQGKPALRGVDLKINENEIFALLGPTGAGKSSTLLAAAGLIEPNAGRIFMDGKDVRDVDPSGRDVSIVFEGINLLPVFDVKDNIAFALRSPVYREDEKEIAKRTGNIAELLRISHLLDRDVDTLSGGERQRVAIARALVRRPRLFLLDEPLSALDLKLREGLRSELRSIQRRYKSTMLYATHDFHGAIAVADRLGIIDNGVILQSGTLEEIYAMPANATVGRLIGSPAMAFFDAKISNGEVSIKGGQQRISLSGFGEIKASPDSELHLGVWPEDIELLGAGQPDANDAVVYAIDNRGFERAVQINASGGSFRKIVTLDSELKFKDSCTFRIQKHQGFLFDRATGKRLSHLGNGAG